MGTVDDYMSGIQLYIDTGQYDKANENFLSAIKEFDANASLYFIGGQVAIKLDKLDAANKYIIKAIELDNKNEEYRDLQERLKNLKNLFCKDFYY